ncbi:Dabb family protein [Kitasatospora herbaricolor]|uniref:Dabb family protein n=1 Tax=Kitasatospora herbaricolor TaxID=68217 RepID=UPI0036DE296D
MTVTHVVLVQWKDHVDPAEIDWIRTYTQTLESSIPGIRSVVDGPSTSPENLEAGYDFGLVIVFADALSRDVYLTHPGHIPLAEALQRNSSRIAVFDLEG